MKATLRKQLRILRRSLKPADHAARSRRAAAAIKRMASFSAGARVAIYLPFDGEVHTDALILAARRRRVRLYVPVVSDLRHRRLKFLPLSGPTRPGVFGIAVPRRGGARVAAGRARAWSASASTVSASPTCMPIPGTCAWIAWRPNPASNISPRACNEPLADEIRTRHLQHR
jgi:5-formyltetrahydrofolate cyclo-ligase